MTRSLLIPVILFACVLSCVGQQVGLSDQQALQAAEKAFIKGNWNPKIFRTNPVTRRRGTVDEMFSDQADLKAALLKEFGKGPFVLITYTRRQETLNTNGGEEYCFLNFLVFSESQVAVVDERAYPCPEDNITPKNADGQHGAPL